MAEKRKLRHLKEKMKALFFGTRHVNMFVPAVRLIMLTWESMGVR